MAMSRGTSDFDIRMYDRESGLMYLSVKSPFVGSTREMGGTFNNGIYTPSVVPAPQSLWWKWNILHLKDKGYDDEAWLAVTGLLWTHARVRFTMNDGKIVEDT